MPTVYDPEYYLKNREVMNARTMKNYYDNRAKRLEKYRAYYEKNKEILNAKRSEQRANNKPKPEFKITHNIVVSFD